MILALTAVPAMGSEGAASLYLPGLVGDMLVAVPPQPGFVVAGTTYIQTGTVGKAVLQGAVNLKLDLDIDLGIIGATYSFAAPWIGGVYTVAAAVPFGYANLDAVISGPAGNPKSVGADSFHIADMALTPLQLNWSVGDLSLRFAETIFAPTGGYDGDKVVNLGRNYWAFDTTAAATYFNQRTGTEILIAPGILANTRNDDTDYKTGTEFHLDFTANQFLAANFAIGVRGYYYQQVKGDSGSGALLGNFKGEAVGIGPGFMWAPKFGGGRLSILGKWMTDVHSKNRFDSDYFTLTVAWSVPTE